MSFLDFSANDRQGNQGNGAFMLNPSATAPSSKDQDAADEEALMAEFQKNPQAALSLAERYLEASQAPQYRQPINTLMTELLPVAGFVVETRTTKASGQVPIGTELKEFSKDTPIFINICHADSMPKPTPAVVSEEEIQKAINAVEGATYQVPFQLSPPREYQNKSNKTYLVVDACIHTQPYKRTETDLDFKLYIMELAMEWVEEKCRMDLSRSFSLPDVKSKDELKARSVILPKAGPIQEVEASSGTERPQEIEDSSKKMKKKFLDFGGDDTSAPKASPILLPGQFFVPAAGKDNIILQSRFIPCKRGTLGIIVEIKLPNHKSIEDVTLDVVLPDKLVLHSKSQGQDVDHGKEYHAEVDMPNEPIDLDTISAEFNKDTRTLRVYTLKKRRNKN
ncbi:hypothetical protein EMPS_00339 [Entomortierella parvispora]|uniref:PIH1 domain-containing protein 1 n=1 Tax=Entomortierella parvispora TaxID=205924 RepID=A0A9P3H1H2_9FUNG|nr:hypothetical protein EMPS_00339 [Entomortierella parvispora]